MHNNPVAPVWASLNQITPWWPVIAALIVIVLVGLLKGPKK